MMMEAKKFVILVLIHSALYCCPTIVAQDDQTEQGVNSADSSFYGGDIRLTSGQSQTLVFEQSRSDAPNLAQNIQNAVLNPDIFDKWENRRIAYRLDTDGSLAETLANPPVQAGSGIPLSSTAINAINAAIQDYEQQTCLDFVPWTNEQDYIFFFVGRGCYSYIGKIGGPQEISIGNGCQYKGIVIHEIFHALGRFHEQSRPDRDMYVTINDENIRSGFESNFDEADPRFVTTQGVAYDFGSVMHYDAYGFSRNGQPTIVPRPEHGISLNNLGQRDGFSQSDILHANLLYCDGVSFGQWNAWGSWSACSRTCNGGTRSRTRTCTTSACDGSGSETEDCNTNDCPPLPTWSSWTSWSACSNECGGGTRRRTRTCLNGNTCPGLATSIENCNEQACPQPTTWGAWGSWSSCSKTCATGEQIRRRNCVNGNDCEGLDFERRDCNGDVLCQPDPSDGEWSSWSDCTKTCGTGSRTRTRNCGLADISLCNRESQPCNTDECPDPEPTLKGHVYRGCYFVPTYASPLRLLERETPDLSDNPFTRLEPIKKCGAGAVVSNYRAFSVAVGVCISGSSNIIDYQTSRRYEDFCDNGVGGYYFGYYFMSVYEVVDLQSFSNTAGLSSPPEPSPSPSPMPDEESSGVAEFSLPSIVVISLTLLISVSFVLFNY